MKKALYITGSLLLLLTACVSSYDPQLQLHADLVVVDGIITNQATPQTIALSRARSNADSSSTKPISKATVEVLVNGTTTLLLREVQPGIYQLPDGFVGKVGNTYQLRFRTIEGASYQSSPETMASGAPIIRAYDQFNPNGQKKTADALPTPVNDVYIDFQDSPGERNFYLWRWRLYEMQVWCATCQQGRYTVQSVGPIGSGPINVLGCVVDPQLGIYNLYDYQCRSQCWDIFYTPSIDVFSDVYTDGQVQTGHKVASIPIYQLDPALITIEQLSLSANAYRYYKLFADQNQNTGTLADSPPAPIAGNIKNVGDALENVVGYFSAASVSVINHKIIRTSAPVSAGQFQGLFYFENNRKPNVEITNGVYGQGVPSAICVSGRSRTDLLPPGWND